MAKVVAGIVVNGCTLTGFERLQGEVCSLTECSEMVKPGWRARKRILRAIYKVRQYHHWWQQDEEANFLRQLEEVLKQKSPKH